MEAVFSFGDNYYGQLGLNDTNNRLIPTLIPYLSNVIAIAAGISFTEKYKISNYKKKKKKTTNNNKTNNY